MSGTGTTGNRSRGQRWRFLLLVSLSCLFVACTSLSPEPDTSAGDSASPPGDESTALPGKATADPGHTTPPSGLSDLSLIEWRGQKSYIHGVNAPWYNWGCDFGCGEESGLRSSSTKSAIEPRLAALQLAGVRHIRWWMFPGEPWQIQTDAAGNPTGIEPGVYLDIEEALGLAERYDLHFTFVLFSSPSALPPEWLDSESGRAELANQLGEFFAQLADEPRIFSWEVFNEPEWEMWADVVSTSATVALVDAIASSVHENTSALVSVGSANLEGLAFWRGVGLDYYDAHWYDPMSGPNDCARCTDYPTVRAKYQLDAPLVIGEFYAGPETDALDRLTDFYEKGYAGAWAWSLFSERTQDRMEVDLDALGQFAAVYADEIGP